LEAILPWDRAGSLEQIKKISEIYQLKDLMQKYWIRIDYQEPKGQHLLMLGGDKVLQEWEWDTGWLVMLPLQQDDQVVRGDQWIYPEDSLFRGLIDKNIIKPLAGIYRWAEVLD